MTTMTTTKSLITINSPPIDRKFNVPILLLAKTPLYSSFPYKSIRLYSTNLATSSNSSSRIPVKSYENIDTMRLQILKENKGLSGIYRWVNNINGNSYIGSAVNLSNRLYQHYWGKVSSIILQHAIDKYGLSNFSIQIPKPLRGFLLEREQFYFDLFSPEYNINPTVGSRLGAKHSEVSRKKISDIRSGIIFSEETKETVIRPFSTTIYIHALA